MDEIDRDVRIQIDQAQCVGSGLCEALEPQAVQVGGDGFAHTVRGGWLPEGRARVIAENCPTQAISVVEVDVSRS